MPVPRKLSSSCGVCARFDFDNFKTLLDTDVDKVFRVEGHDYEIIYDNDI